MMLHYVRVGSTTLFLPLAYGKVTIVYTRGYTQLSGLRIYARIAYGQTQTKSLHLASLDLIPLGDRYTLDIRYT